MSTAATEERPAKRKVSLKRDIGVIGLLWASMGSIIGSGWLFGAQKALYTAGPAAIISWVIGGVAILILALVHAELGAMYPVSGGSARFPHYAFGGVAGASFGWFSWLQAATVAPIEVSAVILYMSHYSIASGWLNADETLTASGLAVAIVLMAILSSINFLGIRILANVNSAATWWKVGVPLLTIFVVALSNFHTSNFSAANGFSPAGAHGILAAVATSGVIFAYLGFEQADQLAGESKNPKRDIPLAVVGSIVLGLIIYIALQIVFIGALPSSAIGHSWLIQPAAATGTSLFNAFSAPWAELAAAVSIGWLASLLYFDAVISPAGTGLIYTAATSRVSYGLSRNGYIPSAYEKLNERGVPWLGVITSFVIGCICFLPFPSWQSLIGLITAASVLMYAGAPLSFGVLRSRLPDTPRPYRTPAGTVMGPLAFIVANFIILWSGWETAWKLGIAILIGYLILIVNRVFKLNPITPVLDWRAAQWLPVYLVGMGLIVYLSDYGPLTNPWFPLWWDMGVVAVFSLIIYFWAQKVALSREQIEQMVNEVVVPEEGDLDVPLG